MADFSTTRDYRRVLNVPVDGLDMGVLIAAQTVCARSSFILPSFFVPLDWTEVTIWHQVVIAY